MATNLLIKHLGKSVSSHVYIDFCAGAGGPTPRIAHELNKYLAAQAAAASDAGKKDYQPVNFLLTDLFPNPTSWEKAAARTPRVSFERNPVDASDVPKELIERYKKQGKKIFRLFNLAFHHFDDPLAKRILKNTLETSDGFA
jgi:uncharacterized protein YegL